MGGALYYVIIIAAILGCVGFLVWNKKKQAGTGSGGASKPPQKGIIR